MTRAEQEVALENRYYGTYACIKQEGCMFQGRIDSVSYWQDEVTIMACGRRFVTTLEQLEETVIILSPRIQ